MTSEQNREKLTLSPVERRTAASTGPLLTGPEVKNGSSAKNGAPEAPMRDNREGELDHAKDVRRHCKKNSSVLSCIGKRRL